MSDANPKTALLFPGQGAQSVGMGAAACEQAPAARELFGRAAAVLGFDLLKLCTQGPADQLDTTEFSQPALFVAGLAALEVLRQDDPEAVAACQVTAGLSLGEYTALVFAGVMDFEPALRVVQARGKAMQEASDAVSSGMVSVLGLDRQQVEALCDAARQDQVLQVANMLCPGNIVVSGEQAACERVAEMGPAAGAMRVLPLAVAGAFHTSLMQPAVAVLQRALAEVELRTPRIPVLLNVDAAPHKDPEEIRRLLAEQVVSPVLWEDTMRRMIDEYAIETFYELGPGRVLAGLLKRINRKLTCVNVAA